MSVHLQFGFKEGAINVPVFVDPDESDDVEDYLVHTGDILFAGFDSEFRTVVHILNNDGVGVEYPSCTIDELRNILGGAP